MSSTDADALLTSLEEAAAVPRLSGTPHPRAASAWLATLASVSQGSGGGSVALLGGTHAARARPVLTHLPPTITRTFQNSTAADLAELVQAVPRRDLPRLGAAAVRAVRVFLVLPH